MKSMPEVSDEMDNDIANSANDHKLQIQPLITKAICEHSEFEIVAW